MKMHLQASQKSLLQTVIHNLVDSTDESEREVQRNKLQDDLEVADERLDELVKGKSINNSSPYNS